VTPDAGSHRARGRQRWSRDQWERRQAERYEWEWSRATQQAQAHRSRAREQQASWSAGDKGDRCSGDWGGGIHDVGLGRPHRKRRHPVATDVTRAVLLGVFLVLVSTHAADGSEGRALDGLAYSLLVAESVSFLWWRRRPWLHWSVALAVSVLWYGIGYANGPVIVPLLLGVLGVSSTRSLRSAMAAAAGPVAVVIAATVGDSTVVASATLIVSGWTLVMLVAGRMNQAMRERRLAWREWAAAQEREQEATTRRDADEERMRIAREVHDVVSHNLAVIRVQASVALHLLDTDKRPEQAREALAAIKQSSADALADLRSTLDVLRNPDDAEGVPRTPGRTASLTDLAGLVANAEAAGLPVELTVRGPVDDLPDDLALAGYRVVQEAITNVIRHAGPARADVIVDRSVPSRLVIEVRDDGVGAPAADTGGSGEPSPNRWGGGHGITGMRERVEALGGDFYAGPAGGDDGSGFRVRAVLPVPDTGGPVEPSDARTTGAEPSDAEPSDAGATR